MKWVIQNFIYILPIIVIIGGGGLWILVITGVMHKIIDMLRPNSDKHIDVKMLCEDRQIRDRRLKIERYCITDEKKARSFHLVHELLLNSAATGKQFLCIPERDDFPIDFNNKLSPADRAKYPSAQKVFIDTTADIRSQASKESTSNFMGMSLSIIALSGALIFVIMAIILFWKGQV